MIYKLRRKFIGICVACFAAVFLVLLVAIFVVTTLQTNASLDMLADIVSNNGGEFPPFEEHKNPLGMPDGINRESPFSTRYFTVQFDGSGRFLTVDTRAIASVSVQEAKSIAQKLLGSDDSRGWAGKFRYKIYETQLGKAMVFVSGMDARHSNQRFLVASCTVFGVCSVIILILVIWFSGRAVKPAAESFEKQKQFITDANHELKTPLTLIRTNLDIMESELGTNEWLTDIREESKIMTDLVNQLVMLARMDEEGTKLEKQVFSLSDAVLDTVSLFEAQCSRQGLKLKVDVVESVEYCGNEGYLRQLVSILMDNAVKYCDREGSIRVGLQGGRHPVLRVDNSCSGVGSMELGRLFDRFYRADRARTYGSGSGIGLSIAKAIVNKHAGRIRVLDLEGQQIRFQVEL